MKKPLILLTLSLMTMCSISCASNFQGPSKEVVDMSLVDSKINPCEDFFLYACGNWLKTNPIPPDKSELFRFTEIDEETLLILKSILQNYQKGENSPTQADSEKLGNAYSACMNITQNEILANKTTLALLLKVNSLKNKKNMMSLLADLHRKGINPFFEISSIQNPGDATHMIATIDQAGMGLPEKAYYTEKDNLKIRKKYNSHIKNSLLPSGINPKKVPALAKIIFKIEDKIAHLSLSALEQQDPIKTYNPIGKNALQKLTPYLDWKSYFTDIQISDSDSLNIVSPPFIKGISSLIRNIPLDELKTYLSWQVIHSTANFSTLSLQQENFEFYGKILNGKKEKIPHWKTCVSSVDNSLGEALG